MVRLVIIDKRGRTVEPDELTDTGLEQIMFECERLKDECEELHFAMDEDE